MNLSEPALDRGVAHHQAGRMQEAHAIYQDVIKSDPENAQALYLLGTLLLQVGQLEPSAEVLRKAVKADAGNLEARCGLGVALLQLGQSDEGTQHLKETLAINPNHAMANLNLARVYLHAGDLNPAEAHLRTTIKTDPKIAEAYFDLGIALAQKGNFGNAIASFRRATKLSPEDMDVQLNLASALLENGDLDKAIDQFEHILKQQPKNAEAHFHNAIAHTRKGDNMGAIDHYQKAMEIDPLNAKSQINLANIYMGLHRNKEAEEVLRGAVEADAGNSMAHGSLGLVLSKMSRFTEAEESLKRSLKIGASTQAFINLGSIYQRYGDFDQARALYSRALEIDPKNLVAARNLIVSVLYTGSQNAAELFENYRSINTLVPKTKVSTASFGHLSKDQDRPLRIGYVSADFRYHPVARNIWPLISGHDKNNYSIYLYSDVDNPDSFSESFKAQADVWHDTLGLTDYSLAELITEDEIDILVVLAGHFAGNRLMLACHRSAPIQISFHDPATSGLDEMDYLLTDDLLHPPETNEKFSEELYRLPTYYQFTVPAEPPSPLPPPAAAAGYVTFGSFNRPEKINDHVVELWSRILNCVPDSRLFLKYLNFYGDSSIHRIMVERFKQYGIDENRLEFGASDDKFFDHLKLYGKVDISLDPFPFNGATTTFESLIAGVPVVALLGQRFVDRVAATLLIKIGHSELTANSHDAYVNGATSLANDIERLSELRAALPGEVLSSTICDGTAYARAVEVAYRDMWSKWCQNP